MILDEYKEQLREFGNGTRSSFSMIASFILFIYFSKLLMKIDDSMITIIQQRKYSTEITFVSWIHQSEMFMGCKSQCAPKIFISILSISRLVMVYCVPETVHGAAVVQIIFVSGIQHKSSFSDQ